MDSFLTFINQQKLDLKQDASLLAVSGGVDSVVMAHLFHKMGFKAGIVHCNFGLRDRESENDEEFVRGLAQEYGFSFYSKKFSTKLFAKEHSISTQMAARELRYKWFEDIREENQYKWIATAHHANDSFETVLLNLARGTGVRGMHGIAAKNNAVIRPMLYMRKEKILAYANEHHLEWSEDRSNYSDDYKRNQIRHHVIPVFQQLNPSIESTFKTTAEKLSSANALLDEFLQRWKESVVRVEGETIRISIENLLSDSEPHYRLWYILEPYKFAYSQVAQIIDSLGGVSGKTFLSSSYILLIDRYDLILKVRENEENNVEWTIQSNECQVCFGGQSLLFSKNENNTLFQTSSGRDIIIISGEKLIFPLKIRSWQEGDIFYPFGMKGKRKKLSDLFTDLKLDRFQKEKIRLLINGNGDIVWVIGIRLDERYKVDAHTESFTIVSQVNQSDFNKI